VFNVLSSPSNFHYDPKNAILLFTFGYVDCQE